MATNRVEKVKELWELWDVRVLILISLLIQLLLTFLAPLRKCTASGFLGFFLWLLYLSASAVALYIISQISGGPDNAPETEDLLAFWAPFLLLHLGGPDTITALALEDNELWHRHALELATQAIVTFYVFVNSILRQKSHLWLPTALMFVDGLIKYVERTQALYYASVDSFRDSLEKKPDPGPNYARFMDEYHSTTSAYIPTEIQGKDDGDGLDDYTGSLRRGRIDDESNDIANTTTHAVACQREDTDKMVEVAYRFYNKFKGLLADSFLSLKDRKESRDIFLKKLGGLRAFRIVEIELNLIYDVFYTKAYLLHTRQASLRIISFLSVVASLLLFCFWDKGSYKKFDVVITFILLGGAVALDISAAVMLIFSDWWIIINSWDGKLKPFKPLFTKLLQCSRWLKRPSCDRWSRSIPQYNLLRLCFKDPPPFFKYIAVKRIKEVPMGWLYVRRGKTNESMIVKFIVDELEMKANLVSDDDLRATKEMCSARGNLPLQDDYCLVSEYLNPWTMDVDYDESLLIWHLATDICYLTSKPDVTTSTIGPNYREISKRLSDYMLYLVLRNQSLVSPVVGMSDIRFDDTCAEAQKFFIFRKLHTWSTDFYMKAKHLMYKITCRNSEHDRIRHELEVNFLKEFCEELLNVKVDVQPIVAKGDSSKSVLFEACRLAKQLKMFGEEKQWEITSKVWVELLCYAAIRCTPRSHVAQLSKGGELVTLVWLLMAHLGLGERFLQNQGFGWTKLIIHK